MSSMDVAIPNFNYGRFLRACVASVQAQAVDNLRILILDNGSTDESLTIARELAHEDARIEIMAFEKNQGMHGAFNACIDWCSADYMTILHADDQLAPGALLRASAFLDQNEQVVMTFGRTAWSDEPFRAEPHPSWRVIAGETFIATLCKTAANPVACAGVIMRTTAQKQVGYYDPAVSFAPDLEMWLRMAARGAVGRCSAPQGVVGRHQNNASATTRERLGQELLEVEIAFEAFFRKEEIAGGNMSARRTQLRQAIGERAY